MLELIELGSNAELETKFKELSIRIDEITLTLPELEQEVNKLKESNYIEIVEDNSIKYVIVSNELAGPYGNCYVDTIKLLKNVDNPSLLENGIERSSKNKKIIRLV